MNQPNDRRRASRGLFLRGVGVTMALPWLESLPSWGAEGSGSERAPKRFAAMFMGCGVNPKQWWAKGDGSEMELGGCLGLWSH